MMKLEKKTIAVVLNFLKENLKIIRNDFYDALQKPIGALIWISSFLGIISLRLFIDNFIAKTGSLEIGTVMDVHNLLFFLITILLIWLLVSLILAKNPFSLSRFMFWGSLLLIFPPLFDILKTKGSIYWSFYLLNDLKGLWSHYITIFGNLPMGNVYFGSKIMFITAIALISGYVYLVTKKLSKTILSALCLYSAFFFMGSLPSWITFAYYFFQGSINIPEVNSINIVQFVGIPYKIFGSVIDTISLALAYNLNLIYFLFLLLLLLILFFAGDRKKMTAFLKNSRIPQVIYHTGLFFVGLGLGYLAYPENLNINIFSVTALLVLISSIWLAWEASVIFNDIYDYKIDEISNPDRPLQKKIFDKDEYRALGLILFILSLVGGLVVGTKFVAMLLVYQVLAWFYSSDHYRLKRFPLVATAISASASLLMLFIGFVVFSSEQNIQGLSWRIIILLLASLTLSLPIKDFKDIEGDKKYGVFTIPVIFGEEKGKLIVAVGIFISFMLSVFLLNEFRLFWWAMLFGGVSYLITTSKKIHPRNLFWWVLGTVSIYGLVLVSIVFI